MPLANTFSVDYLFSKLTLNKNSTYSERCNFLLTTDINAAFGLLSTSSELTGCSSTATVHQINVPIFVLITQH